MAIELLSSPPSISFSRNQILLQFRSDAYYQAKGKPFIGLFNFYSGAAAGESFTLSYADQKLTFTLANVPDNSGYQLPTYTEGADFEAHKEKLIVAFNSNFYINRDFKLSKYDTGYSKLISFESKSTGSLNNLTVTAGYGFGIETLQFSEKDIPNKNFKLFYQLYVENTAQNEFVKVSEAYMPTDTGGMAMLDISTHLTSALLADGLERPNLKAPVASLDTKFLRRYYVRYAEAYGETQVIKKVYQTPVYYVMLGGISNELLEEFAFPDSFISGTKLRFLKQEPLETYIRPEQPEFLTIVTFNKAFAQLLLNTKLYFTDGTTQTIPSITFPNVARYRRLTFPVGFVQSNLHLASAYKQVFKYDVYLVDEAATVVTETKTYFLDYDHKPYTKYFLYLSSFGTYDTKLTYGKGSTAYELVKSTAQVSTVGKFQLMNGEQVDYSTSLTNQETVTTGYRTRQEVRAFKDLFLSRDKFIIKKGRAYPITLASKEISEFKEGDNLFALTFDIGYQSKDQLWTLDEKDELPAGLFFPIIVGGGGPSNGSGLPADYYDNRYYLKTQTYSQEQLNAMFSALQKAYDDHLVNENLLHDNFILLLNGKAPAVHDHDDLYMPKAEMADLLQQLQAVLDEGAGIKPEDFGDGLTYVDDKVKVDYTKVTARSDFDTLVNALVPHPTYNAPSAAASTAATLTGEIGTAINNLVVYLAFTQRDAGQASGYQVKKNGDVVAIGNSYTDSLVLNTAPVTYQGVVYYYDGTVKQNIIGINDPTGRILAGSVASNVLTAIGYRNLFAGFTANNPRDFLKKVLNPVNGTTFTLNVDAGSERIRIVYPATIRDFKKVNGSKALYVESQNQDIVDNFSMVAQIQVPDANNSNPIAYKVAEWVPVEPFKVALTLTITI